MLRIHFPVFTTIALLVPTSSIATTLSPDARSMAMGNTGVVSADYLTSPFHNPALGSAYREEDDFGLLIPAAGVTVYDKDDAISIVDDAQDLYDSIVVTPTQQDIDTLEKYLNEISDAQPVNVNAALGLVVSIPNQYASLNLYSAAYVELIADATVSDETDPITRYNNSEVTLIGFGSIEYGVSLSKDVMIQGQRFSFGFTPKYQDLYSYSQRSTLDTFDIDDFEDSEIKENAFNLDIGTVWYYENWRVGLVGKNLIKQDIDTRRTDLTYELTPMLTAGGGYSNEWFSAALDVDLTTQERFKGLSGDDTQFLRFGVEFNAWGWAQLRAGYENDLEDSLDDSLTAGIGFSPWDVVSFDVGGSYAGENQYGASANVAFTF